MIILGVRNFRVFKILEHLPYCIYFLPEILTVILISFKYGLLLLTFHLINFHVLFVLVIYLICFDHNKLSWHIEPRHKGVGDLGAWAEGCRGPNGL